MATLITPHDVLPLIYEASRNKEAYPVLLQSIMQYMDVEKGAIQIENLLQQKVQSGGVFFGYDQSSLDSYIQHYSMIEPWTSSLIENYSLTHASFIPSRDLITFKDYRETEFYQDWGKSLDLKYTIGCVLQLTTDLSLKVAVQKGGRTDFSREDVRKINQLWPYLNQLLNLMETSDIQSKKHTPFWIIDESWKVKSSHHIRENRQQRSKDNSLSTKVIKELDNQLIVKHREAAKEIERAFHMHLTDQIFHPIRVKLSENQILFIQAYQSVADIVHSPQKQLLIYIKTSPTTEMLAENLDISIKNARLLQCILEGETIQRAAARLHCSVHTARAALKRLFIQFNVQSQVELIQVINQKLHF